MLCDQTMFYDTLSQETIYQVSPLDIVSQYTIWNFGQVIVLINSDYLRLFQEAVYIIRIKSSLPELNSAGGRLIVYIYYNNSVARQITCGRELNRGVANETRDPHTWMPVLWRFTVLPMVRPQASGTVDFSRCSRVLYY